MNVDEIAEIIWDEHSRWDGKPAPRPKETWGYRAAERISKELEREDQIRRCGFT